MKQQSAISAVIQAGASIVTFAAAAFLGKKLGISELGNVGLLLSFVTLGGTAISLGVAEQVQFSIASINEISDGAHRFAKPRLIVPFGFQVLLFVLILSLSAGMHFLGNAFNEWAAVTACAVVAGFFSVIGEISARIDFQHGHFARGQITNSAGSIVFWIVESFAIVLNIQVSYFLLVLGAWGVVAAASIYFMRGHGVSFRLRTSKPMEGQIQGSAFMSRLAIACNSAFPFIVFQAIGVPAFAGVLSLVSRLLGPIGIIFSSITLTIQQQIFRAPQQRAAQTKTACKVQLFISVTVSLLVAAAAYLIQISGIYDFGLTSVKWWSIVILLLLIHRGLSMAFQFSAQSLLPFYSMRQVAVAGLFSCLFYVPLLVFRHSAVGKSSDMVITYMFGALILQPLLAVLGIWRYSGINK